MADEQPEVQPQSPPDPFTQHHADFMQVLEWLRNYRRAGGGLIESAVLVAAHLAVAAAGGEPLGGEQE